MNNIVVGQINPIAGDIWGNVERIVTVIKEARAIGARLVVFPQFALCGVPVHDLVFHKDFCNEIEKAIVALAKETKGLSAIVGTILSDGAIVHDGAVIFRDGCEIGRQHVMGQLWDLEGLSVGILVGEGFSQSFSSTPDIVVHLVASAWVKGVVEQRHTMANTIVSRTSSPYLFVNLVGGNDEWVFDGRSFLITDEGEPSFQAEAFREGAFPLKEGSFAEEVDDIESVYEALRLGIQDFFRKSQKERAIVPLSGSLDSAVVAALAVQALGRKNVWAISSDPQVIHTAQKLGIELRVVARDFMTNGIAEALGSVKVDCGCTQDLMCGVLCHVASGLLCLSTENKTGFMLGSMACDGSLAPLGDLFTTQVHDLARFLQEKYQFFPEVLEVSQKSRAVDATLQHIFVQGDTVEETARQVEVPLKMVADTANRVLRHEYRRRQAPCVLKVSTIPEAKYPIVNRYTF